MAQTFKNLTPRERKFAKLLADGYSVNNAALKIYGWECSKSSPYYNKAKSLAQSTRVRKAVKEFKEKDKELAVVEEKLTRHDPADFDNIGIFAFEQLKRLRDDPTKPSRVRYEALQALEKLSDPAHDLNLIWKYIETVWGGLTAHCPCCHKNFALADVENEKLNKHLEIQEKDLITLIPDPIDRRLHLLDIADKRRSPRNHVSQMKAIAAPERHVIAKGLARGGKSLCLAFIGFLHLLVPGSRVWILARTYNEAEHEFMYMDNMLYTMFYPIEKHMYDLKFDKKTGDASITTRWGSELTVKSAKAKGSITGQELDAILIAEPGWVEADIYEEVRARMSSRLGRIFAMGTPKGYGNFLGRLMRSATRDMRTGKKLPLGAKLIENGCPWSQSLLVYEFRAQDNPEYVLSELESAKRELTEAEYASEFEGQVILDNDRKFPFIRPIHIRPVDWSETDNCSIIVGVDQGPKNFAYAILGWDGKNIFVLREFLDQEKENTMKSIMVNMNLELPSILMSLRLPLEAWKLTIFDADPPVDGILHEMKTEGREWKTEVTFRPKNIKEFLNWRDETCTFVNEMARSNQLIFAKETDLLHDQLMEALDITEDTRVETKSHTKKNWILGDTWRGDHVADAFLLAMWTIYQNLINPNNSVISRDIDIYEQLQQKFEYEMRMREKEELKGYTVTPSSNEIYHDVFGHDKPQSKTTRPRKTWYYPDA